jgi:hypothetical protein
MTTNNVQSDEENPLRGLPIKRCDTRFCVNEGRFTDQRIICVGKPIDHIIGWCKTCRRYVCLGCALIEQTSEDDFWALDDESELKRLCTRLAAYPVAPKCRHCGEFLGAGEETLILVDPDIVRP